jgi:hypothetical protein
MSVMNWRRIGSEWQLFQTRRIVGRVAPDATWPGMWRVALPGGMSDLVNLTRAKDAARVFAARRSPRPDAAEIGKKAEQYQRAFSRSSSLVRLSGPEVTRVPTTAETHQRPSAKARAGRMEPKPAFARPNVKETHVNKGSVR